MPCKTRSEVSRDLLHRVECHGLKTVRFSGSGFGNDLRIMGSMIHLFRCTLNPVGRRNKKTSSNVRSIRSGDATENIEARTDRFPSLL